jgi:hypothetical protein
MSFAEYRYARERALELPRFELAKLALTGVAIIFAALGMGEAVYRIVFMEFDGATDRLPIETMFGIAFAFAATKFLLNRHDQRMKTKAKLEVIRKRNEKIRAAVTAISPLPLPGQQQAIRVIREEVETIGWHLSEICETE